MEANSFPTQSFPVPSGMINSSNGTSATSATSAKQKFSQVMSAVKAGMVHGAAQRSAHNVHKLAAFGAISNTAVVVGATMIAGLPGLLAATAIQGATSAYAERAAYHAGFAAGQASAK